MSRIAERVKSNARGNIRTGAAAVRSMTTNADGSVTTVYLDGTSTTAFPNGNGRPPCGPAPATQPMSWGAACPTGNCTADTLAANLNRAFAGERYPCREIPYWIEMTGVAGGTATFDGNSKVTICPTRVIVHPRDGSQAVGVQLSRFEIGNQNQVVGDPIPIQFLDYNSYVIIPFVTDCIKAGMPFGITIIGTTTDDIYDFGIIGPAIG